MKSRVRIDCLLVNKGLVDSRKKAQAIIMAGKVLADDQRITKPGQQVLPNTSIRLTDNTPKYVSRAGIKLEAALAHFSIKVAGNICLDVGASTGGFTDCLLQHGAHKVHSIDVGKGQLHWNLRRDSRVVIYEGLNARYLTQDTISDPVDLACCDVSFISATLIVPVLTNLLKWDGAMIVLVKPQFEVGKDDVGKGGIVRDTTLHRSAMKKVRNTLESCGFSQFQEMESPILGAKGNQEFLLHAWKRMS